MAKALTYHPLPGEHIAETCNNAVALARSQKSIVQFTHNDVTARVTGLSDAKVVEAFWRRQGEKQKERFRNSKEGFATRVREKLQHLERQRLADELYSRLVIILDVSNMDALIGWLGEFLEVSGWSSVRWDKDSVISRLKNAGFEADWGVGHPPTWFDTRDKMGRYLIGQAINFWEKVGCCPDILVHWCQVAYNEMPQS